MTSAGQPRALACALGAALALLTWAAPAPASNTMGVQPDGRVVLAGAAQQPGPGSGPLYVPALVRLNSDGSGDRGFAADGGLVDFRQEATPFQAVATTSRAILAGYGSFAGGYRVMRFEGDGDVDANFGIEGTSSILEPVSELGADLSSLLALPDGSLLVAGSVDRNPSAGGGFVFAHQLRADGEFADSVGRIDGGPSEAFPPSLASHQDLMLLPDGSSVLLWTSRSPDGTTVARVSRLSTGRRQDFAALPSADLGSQGAGLALDGAGRVVVAYDSGGRPALARFGADGSLDLGFGQSGVARLPLGETIANGAAAVAAQPDGGILLGGWSQVPCAEPPGSPDGCWRLFVARFDSAGELDASYGTGGVARIARRADDAIQPTAIDLAALPDGAALISATPAAPGESEFLLARLDPGGRLDPAFGQGGVATTTPCQGSVAENRRNGCLSHARASLRIGGLAKGRPRGRLRLNTDNLLDPMARVSIGLPRSLRGVPRKTKRLRAVTVPRARVGKRVGRRSISVRIPAGARGASIGFPAGLLTGARRVRPGHKLVFRVEVTFNDGSRERIPVRVAP